MDYVLIGMLPLQCFSKSVDHYRQGKQQNPSKHQRHPKQKEYVSGVSVHRFDTEYPCHVNINTTQKCKT